MFVSYHHGRYSQENRDRVQGHDRQEWGFGKKRRSLEWTHDGYQYEDRSEGDRHVISSSYFRAEYSAGDCKFWKLGNCREGDTCGFAHAREKFGIDKVDCHRSARSAETGSRTTTRRRRDRPDDQGARLSSQALASMRSETHYRPKGDLASEASYFQDRWLPEDLV